MFVPFETIANFYKTKPTENLCSISMCVVNEAGQVELRQAPQSYSISPLLLLRLRSGRVDLEEAAVQGVVQGV